MLKGPIASLFEPTADRLPPPRFPPGWGIARPSPSPASTFHLDRAAPGPPSSRITSAMRPRTLWPGVPPLLRYRFSSRYRRDATIFDPPSVRSRRLAQGTTRRIMGCMKLSSALSLSARVRRRPSRSARYGYQALGYVHPRSS